MYIIIPKPTSLPFLFTGLHQILSRDLFLAYETEISTWSAML